MLEVTRDFVDCTEEKYLKTFLGLCPVAGYSREDQFDILLSILQEYSIVQKYNKYSDLQYLLDIYQEVQKDLKDWKD